MISAAATAAAAASSGGGGAAAASFIMVIIDINKKIEKTVARLWPTGHFGFAGPV
jgi:hypothetical protein